MVDKEGPMIGMIGGMGMPELLVILGIAVIIFGAGRIPEIAKSLGKAVKEFKKAGDEISGEIEEAVSDKPKDDG